MTTLEEVLSFNCIRITVTLNIIKRGGGIYVEDDNAVTIMPCFFQLLDLQYPQDMYTLENNTANEAGSAMYGGEIYRCLVYLNQLYNRIDSVFTIISSVTCIIYPVAVHMYV